MKKSADWLKIIAWIFVGLSVIAASVLVYCIFVIDVLPLNLINLLIGAVALMLMICCVLACFSKIRVISVIFSVLVLSVTILGGYYLNITNKALNKIVSQDENEIIASVISKAESYVLGARSMNGKKVAYVSNRMMKGFVDKAIEEVNREWSEVEFVSYSSYGDAVEALFSGEVDAFILLESSRFMIEDNYSDFEQKTVILTSYSIPVDSVAEESEESSEEESEQISQEESSEDSTEESGNSAKDNIINNAKFVVPTKPFVIFLSGCDSRSTSKHWLRYGRSDVNILAAVNPVTKVVLLVTTPRDTYMNFAFNDDLPDKLTHASIWASSKEPSKGGPYFSMDVLEDFYDIEISKFVKIGFYGFADIVDAIGGLDVYSAMEFTTRTNKIHFDAGVNHLNGKLALAFVRERYGVGGFEGDMQRNRNQAALLTALIEKLLQPEILVQYSSILKAIESNMMTNLTNKEIGGLVKMQLTDNAKWKIMIYSVTGTSGYEICYSYDDHSLLPVIYANETEVNKAKKYMKQVLNGETPVLE